MAAMPPQPPMVPPGALGAMGAPPPAPPAAALGGANPAAQLAGLAGGKPGGGIGETQLGLLLFMAGMGADKFKALIQAMRGDAHGKGGMKADSSQAPMQSIPPQLAAIIAAQRMRQATPMPSSAVPPPNPLMSMVR